MSTSSSNGEEEADPSDPNTPIKAFHLSLELKRRCVALNNLKEAVKRADTKVLKEEDVWTIYLMLLENG